MKHYLLLYFATLVVMTVLDLTWLGVIARSFYRDRIGHMMEFRLIPAVIFYFMYIGGVTVFVHSTYNGSWQQTAIYGALFGFFAYATYDLTNLATLRGWPVTLSVVDILWGVITTSAAATAGRLIAGWIE